MELRTDPDHLLLHSSGDLRRRLRGLIRAAASERASRSGLVRLEVPASGLVAPLPWLRAQAGGPKHYWAGREDGRARAGVGAADVIEGEAPLDASALDRRLGRYLADAPADACYLGGLRFDPRQAPDAAWADFGGYRFVLPRFELVRDGDRARLACNLVLPRDADQLGAILDALDALVLEIPPHDLALPLPQSRRDDPCFEGWTKHVEWALDAFERTPLDKVVLARKVTFGFGEWLDPYALLSRLEAATPHCFHFLIEPAPGATFVGASPERLFSLNGRDLRSEAVAGTRPRGDSASDDARLRDELLQSEKDLREHGYVRTFLHEALQQVSERLEVDAGADAMTLTRGRHLRSRVEARLRSGVTAPDLLARLHPTPAVGGTPTALARRAICTLESFDRGWYAGPVGCIGRDAAEFAVAIRSGLVQGRTLALYSGAGIVRGSVPQAEWDEIEHKISDFLSVLGLTLDAVEG